MGEWMPIESAPRDGKPFLLAYAKAGKAVVREARWRLFGITHRGMFQMSNTSIWDEAPQLLGWQPMPKWTAPPASAR